MELSLKEALDSGSVTVKPEKGKVTITRIIPEKDGGGTQSKTFTVDDLDSNIAKLEEARAKEISLFDARIKDLQDPKVIETKVAEAEEMKQQLNKIFDRRIADELHLKGMIK